MSLSSKMANNINTKKTNKDDNINDEWSSFISNHYEDDDEADLIEEFDGVVDDDDAIDVFGNSNKNPMKGKHSPINSNINSSDSSNIQAPEPSEIYISTKSKIAYLTEPVDLKIFWDIPVIPYSTASNGVIKKQIKFNSKTPEELNIIQERLKKELYYPALVIPIIQQHPF